MGLGQNIAGSLLVRVGADLSHLQSGMGKAKSIVAGTAKQMVNLGAIAENAGKKMTMKMTLPVAAGFGIAAKMAGGFEQELNVLQATLQASGSSMKEVSKLAQQLGADTSLPATSAADAAVAMTQLAKGGLKLTDVMKAARGTLLLAAAANITEAEAANITANSLNMFQLAGDKATKVTDLLAAAANASTGEISDMALALSMGGTVAHQAGQSIEDTVTAISMMAKAGVQSSDAGTSIKTMFLRLMAPTKKVRELMDDMGVSVRDQTGKIRPLRDLIGTFSAALRKMGPAQRDFAMETIFGTDAIRAANIILARGVTNYDTMSNAVTRQGAAQEMAAARMKGFNGALEKAKNAASSLGVTLGLLLLPAFTAIINFGARVVSAIAGMPSWFHKLALGFAAVAAAAGPMLVIGVKIAKGLVAIKIAMLALQAASFLGASGLGKYVMMLKGLQAIPMVGLAAGATALAFAGVSLLASMTKTKSAAQLYADNLNKEAAAHRNAAAAARDQKAAIDGLAGSALDVQESALRVREAQARVNQLQKEGKKGTAEYTQANIDLSRAVLNNRDAHRRVAEATNTAKDATKKHIEVTREDLDIARKNAAQAAARAQILNRVKAGTDEARNATKLAGEAARIAAKREKEAAAGFASAGAQAAGAAKQITATAGPAAKKTQEVADALNNVAKQEVDAGKFSGFFGGIAGAAAGAASAVSAVLTSIRNLASANISAPSVGVGGWGGGKPKPKPKGKKGAELVRTTSALDPLRSKHAGDSAGAGMDSMAKKVKKSTADVAEALRQALDRASQAIDQARSGLATRMGRVADFMFKAFDSQTEVGANKIKAKYDGFFRALDAEFTSRSKAIDADQALLTPAEAALKSLQDNRAEQSLSRAITQAQNDLRAAYKTRDSGQILAAQQALNDALLDQQEAQLQKQSDVERTAADALAEEKRTSLATEIEARRTALQTSMDDEMRMYEAAREVERSNLEMHLNALLTQWNNGKTNAKKMQSQIVAAMKKYDVDYRASGNRLGEAFSDGLVDAMAKIKTSAKAVAQAVAAYLKLKSPADKGPLSTIDHWWDSMVPMLTNSLDMNSDFGLNNSALPVGGGRGGNTLIIQVSGNTLLGNSRETAQELARIVVPEINRQVRLTS